MISLNKLPFDVLKSYATALVPVGIRYFDAVNGNWVIFAKQAGATQVTAGMVTVASTTDRNTGKVRISGTGGAELNVAGVRPNLSDPLNQNEFGAIIVNGPALQVLAADQAITTDGEPIVTGLTAGKIQKYLGDATSLATCISSALRALGVFAFSQAVTAGGKCDINIFKSVY